MGAVLNYAIFLCTSVNSPLTTTVVGCLKNISTAYIAMLGFGTALRLGSLSHRAGGDYVFSWPNFIGLNIAMSGGLVYAKVKYEAQKAAKELQAQKNLEDRERLLELGTNPRDSSDQTTEPAESEQ
jgi:solute carrier family 35 protein